MVQNLVLYVWMSTISDLGQVFEPLEWRESTSIGAVGVSGALSKISMTRQY
jgi:hypothetical protein